MNTELLAHTPAPCDDPARCGVHVLRQCGVTGRLTHLSTNAIGPNVAFIVRSPTNPSILYASTERIDDEGEIITLRLTPEFRLVEETRIKAGGRSTCYLNFNASREWMMAVNYWDARVSMVKLGKDGRPDIEAGQDPRSVLQQPGADYVDRTKPTREEHWKFRQRWPHSHCCVTEPYAGLVHFVVDLGLDKVFTYRVNSKTGMLVPKEIYVGLFKALVFGISVSIVSCAAGLRASGGALGVGLAVQAAVRNSVILIIVLGFVISWFFYFLTG